jgi:hypothetical protein
MSSLIPSLLKGKLPKAGSKMHEASSSNHDSPKYDQIQDVKKIHNDIQVMFCITNNLLTK